MYDDDEPFDFIEDVPATKPEPRLPFIWAGFAVTFDPNDGTLTVPIAAADSDLQAWVASIFGTGEVIDVCAA